GRYKSKLHGATDYSVGLAAEKKCELAEVKDEIQRMKKDLGQTLQNLEAVTEEASVWWSDVEKAISGFEKDMISTISSKKVSIVASEKLRNMEEENRQRVSASWQLLRLVCHLTTRLPWGLQKEQMGQTLREVHLQQLHVRNAQYQEKIDEKKEELLQLKLTSGKTGQVLNLYKKKLQDAMETSTSLMKDISQRKELLEKIEREAALVEEQRAKAERVNRQLRKQLSDYSVPPVLSYVQKKMAVADLKNSLRAWERKVAVAEMSLQSYRRAWNQVKMSGNQH
ncbi:Coiled-coil domain-containing protein 113, partial [Leptosomus discolor]